MINLITGHAIHEFFQIIFSHRNKHKSAKLALLYSWNKRGKKKGKKHGIYDSTTTPTSKIVLIKRSFLYTLQPVYIYEHGLPRAH